MGAKKGGKRRFWSDEEKRLICMQTRSPNVSVAQVARRYAMNANLIQTWLRDARFAPSENSDATVDADFVTFLPVEVSEGPAASSTRLPVEGALTAQRIEIALSDGRRILIEGCTSLAAVVALVEGLAR